MGKNISGQNKHYFVIYGCTKHYLLWLTKRVWFPVVEYPFIDPLTEWFFYWHTECFYFWLILWEPYHLFKFFYLKKNHKHAHTFTHNINKKQNHVIGIGSHYVALTGLECWIWLCVSPTVLCMTSMESRKLDTGPLWRYGGDSRL